MSHDTQYILVELFSYIGVILLLAMLIFSTDNYLYIGAGFLIGLSISFCLLKGVKKLQCKNHRKKRLM